MKKILKTFALAVAFATALSILPKSFQLEANASEKVNAKNTTSMASEASKSNLIMPLSQTNSISTDDIVVLYTNDSHNAYEKSDKVLGYAAIAAYKKELEAQGKQVILVDAGDAIQGEIIGSLSQGKYIADIMGQTGYSIAVPGNHEFDFGMQSFLDIAENAKYEYISCNFMDLKTGETVFEPYKMVDYNGIKIAYVGISTPETFTKSTPVYFQDEEGNYIYGFCEGNKGKDLYAQVQKTVDSAKNAGANYVIAIGHTGIDIESSPWTTYEIIENITGINAYIDGHSHSIIESEECKDKDGNMIVLSSTGTKLSALGQLTIPNGKIKTELIKEINGEDQETLDFVNNISKSFEELKNTVVGSTDIDLVVNNPEDGGRLIRNQETNLGNLVADAYKEVSGADIAFANGGGIRANVEKGNITFEDIIKVNPYGNKICLVEATGQEILDALEHGAQMAGEGESGGFLQVSGLIYEIDTKIPTSVVQDEKGLFVNVSGEYRVKNVMVGDQPLDLKKTYKLASHNYLLKNGGDGYTMFMDNKILLDEFKLDYDALISYFVDTLGGKVSADSQYLNVYGQGRIKVIVNSEKPTCIDNGFIERVQGTGTIIETVLATGHNYGEWVVTKEATITEEGVMHRACEDCGHEETKSVAKLLDNSDSSSDSDNNTDSKDIDKLPNTGANFEIIGIVIIAVLGIVIAHLKRKENKK